MVEQKQIIFGKCKHVDKLLARCVLGGGSVDITRACHTMSQLRYDALDWRCAWLLALNVYAFQ